MKKSSIFSFKAIFILIVIGCKKEKPAVVEDIVTAEPDKVQVLLDNEIVEIGDISGIIKDMIFENELLIVSVKTDKDTKYETYIDVIDQLKKAEAKRISLAEPDEE